MSTQRRRQFLFIDKYKRTNTLPPKQAEVFKTLQSLYSNTPVDIVALKSALSESARKDLKRTLQSLRYRHYIIYAYTGKAVIPTPDHA